MAGEGDAERLVVLLEARIRDFEKNMKKASGTADKSYGRMRRESRSATQQMEEDMVRSTSRINQALASSATKIGSYGKAFVGGLIGGIVAGGVAGAVSKIGQVANGIAQIGDEAKRAGVSLKAFQEWKYVAEQNRIGIDQMTDGLKELNLRADEFVLTGKGSAAEAFQRLGYGAEDLKKKLQDPSALLLEIIGRLGQMDKAAQIRIADEIFGGSAGERFVELLDQGESGIRRTIDEANDLGIVLSDDLVKEAAELDRQFNQVSNTVGTALKRAVVEAAGALDRFIETFYSFENQRSESLDKRLADIGLRRVHIENQILKLRGQQRDASKLNPFGVDYESQIQQLEEEQAALSDTEAQILKIMETRKKAAEQTSSTSSTSGWTPPAYTPPSSGKKSSTRDREAEAAKREAEAVAELIANLEHELTLIGATDLQREISNTLRDAGAAATDQQRAKIVALVTALHAEAEAQQTAADSAQVYQDMTRGVIGDMRSALADGKLDWNDLADIALNAMDRIIDKMMNDLLATIFQVNGAMGGIGGTGGGGSSALLSAAIAAGSGGLWADGTANTGGRRGEPRGVVHGQEAVIPLPNNGKVPVQISGGAAAPVAVHVTTGISADSEGNLRSFVENVSTKQAIGITQAAAPRIAESGSGMARKSLGSGEWDSDMGRFGARPQVRNYG